MGLQQFLESRGIFLTPKQSDQNDGYISPSQKEQFSHQLSLYPEIRRIAEIGFNGGQSAELFFDQCKNLEFFAAFDINYYPCTRHAVEYFYQAHPNRFLFIQGDSLEKVPEINERCPALKFDLIYIDGNHDFKWCLGDIENGRKMAHEKTILWIDDVEPENPVGAAVKFCKTIGWIVLEQHFTSNHPVFGKRDWIQARYRL